MPSRLLFLKLPGTTPLFPSCRLPIPQFPPNANPLQMVTEVLAGVGVDGPTARDLARSFPAWKCRAMAAYARDRGVKNPGGVIRQGL